MPQTTLLLSRVGISVFFLFLPLLAGGQIQPSSASTVQANGSARIVWDGKPKITRYRLQLASNELFTDIVFDKVVQGREYRVTEIPPGTYFWRVAPAAGETGIYSKPVAVVVSVEGGPDLPKVEPPTLLSPPGEIGWRTATGLIEQPVAAKLRTGMGFDVIGVNSYGMAYAIDGQKGVALWSARYRPGAKKGEPVNSDGAPGFAPLVLEAKDNTTNVLVAFDGGLRALEGATGREIWRSALSGEAIAGTSLNLEGGATAAVVLDNSRTLTFLKGDSGQVISQTKLEGLIVGNPTPLSVKNERGVLVALNNGSLDVRNMAGVSILAIKLDSIITSGPVVVQAARGNLVMLGTEAGLVALDAADLHPLWRVATEGDAPTGMLATVDLESDGIQEIVMITRLGRLVAVNVDTGKIKWFVEKATDALKAAFADLNGDGTKDVIVASGTAFAVGYSGKDGTLIWRAEETATSPAPGSGTSVPRGLIAAQVGTEGSALLVGADMGRTGLRAVGLPAGSIK